MGNNCMDAPDAGLVTFCKTIKSCRCAGLCRAR